MINVSILGATGYAGAELVRLLCMHPQARIAHLVSHSQGGTDLSEIYPNLKYCDLPTLEDVDLVDYDRDQATAMRESVLEKFEAEIMANRT